MRDAAIKQNNLSILGKLTKQFKNLNVSHESKLTEIQYLQRKAQTAESDDPFKDKFVSMTLARSFSYNVRHYM